MTELIIGREAGAEKPRLAIIVNGGDPQYLGTPGCVPKTVSRKHCKITIGKDSEMTVEDLTDNNFMFIKGKECKRMENVAMTDSIELGSSKFRLDMDTIFKGLSGKMTVSVGHLKEIYDTYHKEKDRLQRRQQLVNVLSTLPGVLSMISIGVALSFDQGNNLRVVMITIAAILAFIFAVVKLIYLFRMPKLMKRLDDDYHDKYVCPNTFCNHSLGQMPYRDVLKNHSCPYCHCKYKE